MGSDWFDLYDDIVAAVAKASKAPATPGTNH